MVHKISPPVLQAFQSMRLGGIVHKHDGIGSAVVRVPEGLKALLSSGIPDLQVDYMLLAEIVLNHNFFRHEIGANRSLVLWNKFVMSETVEQGSLADTVKSRG